MVMVYLLYLSSVFFKQTNVQPLQLTAFYSLSRGFDPSGEWGDAFDDQMQVLREYFHTDLADAEMLRTEGVVQNMVQQRIFMQNVVFGNGSGSGTATRAVSETYTTMPTEAMHCAICMESTLKPMTRLECQHAFHTDCLMPWFRSGNATCPLCRGDDSQ
jgi:hypothetical protein